MLTPCLSPQTISVLPGPSFLGQVLAQTQTPHFLASHLCICRDPTESCASSMAGANSLNRAAAGHRRPDHTGRTNSEPVSAMPRRNGSGVAARTCKKTNWIKCVIFYSNLRVNIMCVHYNAVISRINI